MVDSKAYYQLDDGRDAIVFGGRTIRVVDKRQVNYLDGSVVKCWMVPNIEDLLKEKLEFYRRVWNFSSLPEFLSLSGILILS